MVYKPTDPTPNSPENLYSAEELSEVVVGALSEPTEYDAICRAQEILEAKAHEANISLLYAPPKDAMREYHPSEALEEVQAALSFITDLTVEVQDNLMRDLLFDPEIIYSLVLRLRGMFLIDCLLSKEKYSKKKFMRFLGKGIGKNMVEEIYAVYKSVRDNKKTKKRIKLNSALGLLSYLEQKVKRFE